jgi:hypothetical protein
MKTEPTQTKIAVRTAFSCENTPELPSRALLSHLLHSFLESHRWSLTLRRLGSEAPALQKRGCLTSEVGSKADLPRSSRLRRF